MYTKDKSLLNLVQQEKSFKQKTKLKQQIIWKDDDSTFERLLKIYTNTKSLVAEFFAKNENTILVCQKVKRNWLVSTDDADTFEHIKRAIAEKLRLKIKSVNLKFNSSKELFKLSPLEFETYMVRNVLKGYPTLCQSWDGGIDGYLQDGVPIQVKKKNWFGRCG